MDQNDKNKSNKNNDRRRGVLSLLIWALVLTIGFNYLLSAMDTRKLAESTCEIRYDEFLDLVRDGKVKEVEIADRTLNITPVDGFTYTDADGKTYTGDYQLFTTQINDPELRSFLDENGVEFGKPYKAETSYLEIIMLNYVLPTALMVGAFILMMRFISKKTGGGGFGGQQQRRQEKPPPGQAPPGFGRRQQRFPKSPPPAAGNPPQRAHPETARRDHRLAAQQGGGFAQGRAYEVEASRPAFAQFGDEPLDASGQQETSCADGQQVIVGGHRRRGVEIARLRILRPVDEHQPPETPPARTPQRTDARDFEFARTDPLDADHAVARRQRGEFRGVAAGVEHHDHLVTRVFGGEEIFNLRRIRHAAAQDRDADAVGGVAGSPAHGVQQQSFAAGAGDQRQQRAHACRRRSEQQEKDRLHARLRL